MLQYRTLRLYFSASVVYKWKQINSFLLSALSCLIQILGGQTLTFLHTLSVFIPKGFWFFRNFYDETYLHTDSPFKLPRSTGERYHADFWGNRLPFPPKTKNNFSGIKISQPAPLMSLSVPSFSSLGGHLALPQKKFSKVYFPSLQKMQRSWSLTAI